MTREEINRQESRIRQARELYSKIETARGFCGIMRRFEDGIDGFELAFKCGKDRIASISGDDVDRRFIGWLARNAIESIEDHISMMEKEASEI